MGARSRKSVSQVGRGKEKLAEEENLWMTAGIANFKFYCSKNGGASVKRNLQN